MARQAEPENQSPAPQNQHGLHMYNPSVYGEERKIPGIHTQANWIGLADVDRPCLSQRFFHST